MSLISIPKILVVDDDVRLRELLIQFLGEHNLQADGVADSDSMMNNLRLNIYSLYILDINLPGKNGWDICRQLRSSGDNTPIVMLTARSEDHDRIHGLELGADDYLPKPFNTRELLARIRAVLRRFDYRTTPSNNHPETDITFDDYTLSASRNQLLHLGEPVALTATEFLLLKLLYNNRRSAVSRNFICQNLHNRDCHPEDRSIDVLVSRLRKQLGNRPDGSPYIQTVRNQGYILLPQTEKNG
jgi:DNA-binding response OmpR family regulator